MLMIPVPPSFEEKIPKENSPRLLDSCWPVFPPTLDGVVLVCVLRVYR